MLCTKMRSMIPVFLFGIFFVFLAFAVNIDNAKAVNNPYPGTNANNDRHAAWQYAYEGTGVIMPYWGSVETWLDKAKSSGRSTGTTPKKGAIVYFKGTKSSNWNHVAYVNDVKNGKIQIKEGQYYKTNNNPVENVAWVDSKVNSLRFPGKYYEAKLIGYIHIYEYAANDLAGLMGDYIPDGDYQLHSAINDSYVMSVDEGLKNRSNIAIRLNKKNVQTQVFTIKRVQTSNNAYTIADKSGKFAVEVAGSNKMVGGNVQLYNYGVRGSTKFVFQKDGGYYRTKSIVSGNVMDVQGGKANDGQNIHIWAEGNIPARKWRLVPYAININQATINGVVDKVHTGSPVLQQITVSMAGQNLTPGTDYEVKYSNNVNVGTATVTVTGKGAYYGSLQKKFRITAPPAQPANKASEVAKDEKTINKTITRRASDTDVPGSSSAPLWLMQKKATKSAITIKWNKVKLATKYVVYGNKCGKKNKMKKIAVLGKNKKSWTQKKLKKGRYYKYLVVAYNGSNSVAISRTVHIATKGGKATNAGKIKVKKKIVVHKNNKYAIKAIQVRELKKGKIAKHKALMFEPLKTGIAKVSSKGVIRPLKTGKFSIRIVAQNGRFSVVKVIITHPKGKDNNTKALKAKNKKPGKTKIIKCKVIQKKIYIAWKKATNCTKYIVYVCTNGKWKKVCSTKKTSCTYKCKANKKYSFRVCPCNGKVKGSYSVVRKCSTYVKKYKAKRISTNTTYLSEYDFYGNSKKDPVWIYYYGYPYEYSDDDDPFFGMARSYVYAGAREEYCGAVGQSKGGKIWVVAPKGKKAFLIFEAHGPSGNGLYAYKIRNLKLKKMSRGNRYVGLGESCTTCIYPLRYTNRILSLKAFTGKYEALVFKYAGKSCSFKIDYIIKSNGTLKLKSRTNPVYGKKKIFKAFKTFRASSSKKAKKKNGILVKKGKKVKVLKIYIGKNYSSFKIKVGKRTGWISERLNQNASWSSPLLK